MQQQCSRVANAAKQTIAPAQQHLQERRDNTIAIPESANLYQLDMQDAKLYQEWGLESALWQLRSPTRQEWETHLLLGNITMILARAAWHRFQPRDPSAELWNLFLAVGGTGLEPLVLKYHSRFQCNGEGEAGELHVSQDD